MKEFAGSAFKAASVGGAFYIVGRYIIHQSDMDFSSAADWLFRLVLIMFIIWSIVSLKNRQEGMLLFGEGFKMGFLTTSFLALYLALGTAFFCKYINPQYTEGLEESYRALHYNQMMRKYISETWKQDTITQGAIDTIQRGLDLNIEKYTGHLFTFSGQVQTSFLYSFLWGLMISITVSVLARKTADD